VPSTPSHSRLTHAATLPFLAAIYAYRLTLAPLLSGQCRFHPTCSQYALDAYRARGPIQGTLLTLRRLARCHPLCRGGYDPVPLEPVGQSPKPPVTPHPGQNAPLH
jgi:putative membrane protein insertion efficiency factor